MIKVKQKGNFSRTVRYVEQTKDIVNRIDLHKYGKKGVEILKESTPVDTGLTAGSWSYEIKKADNGARLSFKNSNIQNGVAIAILLQYGHATRNGGWVEGVDYINPALEPLFNEMLEEMEKEVYRL